MRLADWARDGGWDSAMSKSNIWPCQHFTSPLALSLCVLLSENSSLRGAWRFLHVVITLWFLVPVCSIELKGQNMKNMKWDRRRHNELSVIAFIWQELKGTKWGASINLTRLVLLKGTVCFWRNFKGIFVNLWDLLYQCQRRWQLPGSMWRAIYDSCSGAGTAWVCGEGSGLYM